MKQTGYVHIKIEKDENEFIFAMPMGASLSDAAGVAFKLFKACDKMYREALDKEIEQKEKEDKEKDKEKEKTVTVKTDSDA